VERHNVPGGCASFYQRDGYRFDVGATLIGGFGARGVHRILNARLGIDGFAGVAIEPSMVVHFPDEIVVRYGDERWPAERVRAFGAERRALFSARRNGSPTLAWDFSTRFPALRLSDRPTFPARSRYCAPFGPRQRGFARHAGPYGSIDNAGRRVAVTTRLRGRAAPDHRANGRGGADLAYGATALDLATRRHLPPR
jgi:phytoene dehydrogenase-like protein